MARWRFQVMAAVSATAMAVGLAFAHPGHENPEIGVIAPEAPAPEPLAQWELRPETLLPRGQSGIFNPRAPRVGEVPANGARLAPARLWEGFVPTERHVGLAPAAGLPRGPFSLELFVTYHVDEPVGAALVAHDRDAIDPLFAFGFYAGDVTVRAGAATLTAPVMELKSSLAGQDLQAGNYRRGALRYWHHLVAVHDGRSLSLWHNGERIAETAAARLSRPSAEAELELAGYLQREAHMRLGDLVRAAALYDRALGEAEIKAAFAHRIAPVEAGAPIPDAFHFTTGAPHVAWPTETGVSLLWETDRPAAARLEWGLTPELGQAMDLPNDGKRVRRARIEGLAPDTAYFYRLTATAPDGSRLEAGPVPFRTAVKAGQPVVFAALSDTEARPHVNARLTDMLWRETPHLVLNAGDLTDGGRADHRFEWTHEYFAAMAPLMARTPFVPVMGNGEDDFVWFERYHALEDAPGRSYYAFRYGDVEFFVLDSNLERRDREDPGFRPAQRAWLEQALAKSQAPWKVVSFHHPPLEERYPKVVEDFVPLFEAHGVDLVLVGHHHAYLRSWPLVDDAPTSARAPIYVQLGGGGGNVSNRLAVPDVRWAKTYQGYGYLMVRAFGDRMSVAMHDDDGAMRDQFSIEKPAAGPWRLIP